MMVELRQQSFTENSAQMMTEDDFIGLAYSKPFDIPEINPEKPETWYFVDIALNMETYAFIKAILDAGHKVIHIDHHRNQEFIETKLDDEQKKLFEHENFTCMYDLSLIHISEPTRPY